MINLKDPREIRLAPGQLQPWDNVKILMRACFLTSTQTIYRSIGTPNKYSITLLKSCMILIPVLFQWPRRATWGHLDQLPVNDAVTLPLQ